MARKKRKNGPVGDPDNGVSSHRYGAGETFDDSEDEFFAGRDEILLEEGPVRKRQRKLEEESRHLQPSDEEVLPYDESITASGDEVENDSTGSEVEGRGWDASKAEYYDANVIENEEDALLEEQEARRLQQKQFQSMTEADFGFDEGDWKPEDQSISQAKTITEALPDIAISDSMSTEEKVGILESRYPEFALLARDFVDLQEKQTELRLSSDATRAVGNEAGVLVVTTQYRAVTAYIGAIAMYFALLTTAEKPSEGTISAMPAKQLREHPLMKTLFGCRALWKRVEDIPIPELITTPAVGKIHPDAAATAPAKPNNTQEDNSNPKSRKPKVLREPPRLQKVRRPKVDDLAVLLAGASQADAVDSDLGDEVPLTAEEAEEKVRKKKSLQFYTSQIAQKAHRRGAASREAGGDDDVPRKERLKDRQAKLLQDAEKRGREAPDKMEELDGEEVEQKPNDYYDMVAAKSRKTKADRKSRAEASGPETYADEVIDPDDKRGITYAIEKNKGLTPRRKKEVRNPRVKKRKKFEEKKKKLGSMRQLYKGGESKGGYGGELTGIKPNVVRSTKL